jgi:hypothetical protein
MDIAVNMETSMPYFQINTIMIRLSAAYGSHIPEWFCTKRKNNGPNWIEQNFDRASENIKPAYHIEFQRQKSKSKKYILGLIEQYPNLYWVGY